MAGMKQIDFAKVMGVNRSTVSRWKTDGRLVLTDEGLVDVEASKARIADTAAGRDDVAARHAQDRGATLPAAETASTNTGDEGGDDGAENSRAYWVMRKERALALAAERNEAVAAGALIPRADVEAAVADVMTVARLAAENLPSHVSPLLVGKDLDGIRATLKSEIHDLLAQMARDFGARLQQMQQGSPA